jgi:putative ABC transport system permease protein
MRMSLTGGRYTPESLRVFYDECLTRVQAAPGVRSAALTHSLPIDGSNWGGVFIAADKPVPSRVDLPESERLRVSPTYFETMGISLLRGRLFNAIDAPDSAPVVVINKTMAERIWPGEEPIGKRIKLGYPENSEPWREVIGVVSDVRMDGAELPATMQAYLLFSQMPSESLGLVLRTERNPIALASTVEQVIHSIDKDLPVYSIRTMDQVLGNSLTQRRLILVLLASLAALALLLSAVGIYGVISYAVRQRTNELGLRMALGAQSRDVLMLILSHGLKLALMGIGVGLLAALALTRSMRGLLFGVKPADAATYALIVIILLLVALLACLIPARRATKVDPMIALRS